MIESIMNELINEKFIPSKQRQKIASVMVQSVFFFFVATTSEIYQKESTIFWPKFNDSLPVTFCSFLRNWPNETELIWKLITPKLKF